ncbi:hypothetical protein JQ625_28295 [Bradyrhizobium diazoefficiens]|nr:hypothetical protein [Bradyrhizobium diazoefficiens]MBR0778746.1 hypothetical protein [Bradyrhizobium diazoefficiens]
MPDKDKSANPVGLLVLGGLLALGIFANIGGDKLGRDMTREACERMLAVQADLEPEKNRQRSLPHQGAASSDWAQFEFDLVFDQLNPGDA